MAEDESSEARKPQATVIDLEAKPVDESAQPAPEAAAPVPPRQVKRRGALWGAVALAAVAALAGGWFYRNIGAQWFPTSAMTSLEQKVEAIEASAKTLGQQIGGLGGDVDRLKAESAQISALAKDAAGGAKSAATSAAESAAAVSALTERLGKAEASLSEAQSAITGLQSALAGGGNSGVTVPPPDDGRLTALAARVEELEKTVAALKAGGAGTPDVETARLLSQTLADLKAKLASGAPYTEELSRLRQLVPAAPGLAELEASAPSGLATTAMLAAQLAKLGPALPGPEAEAAPAEDGLWDWFTSLFGDMVTIRDLGETNWREVAAKAQAFAEAGDLQQAIAVATAAEGEMPAALAAWLAAARARVNGDAAAEALAAAVLRQIAALGGAP